MIEINNSEVEISSTDIKSRIKEGKSIKYLLPNRLRSIFSGTSFIRISRCSNQSGLRLD
jgi:nicotinic acid mononucleotide adenylyltransferase